MELDNITPLEEVNIPQRRDDTVEESGDLATMPTIPFDPATMFIPRGNSSTLRRRGFTALSNDGLYRFSLNCDPSNEIPHDFLWKDCKLQTTRL